MNNTVTISLTDNSEAVKKASKAQIQRALERCGLKAESYAVDLCHVDTGNLRNSISHRVNMSEKAVYIGTNNEYAAYVEFGTGKYKEGGGGRPDPWVYQDDNGKWHTTEGAKPQPFLRPAVSDHAQTYRNIIKDELENG